MGAEKWKGRARLNGEGKGGLRERRFRMGKVDQDREWGRAVEAGRSKQACRSMTVRAGRLEHGSRSRAVGVGWTEQSGRSRAVGAGRSEQGGQSRAVGAGRS
jgi:hypothetical protein